MKIVISYIKDLMYRFKDDEVTALSSQLSYSILISFFPFIIFLMTILGYSPIKSNMVLESLKFIVPQSAFDLIEKTVVEVLDTRQGDLLSFSLILSLWSSSSGFSAVIRGLNRAYDEPETRGYLKVKLISILSAIGLSLMITFSFVLIVFGGILGDYLQCCFRLSRLYRSLWDILRVIVSFFSLVLVFASIYYFIPCRRLKWKEVLPGAVFSTLGWVISSLLFSFYVSNFSNYSRFYGSIGAIFILMTWLYITSVIILLGGELNASLVHRRR